MGCFLGCFGFSGKRRRRKPANKVLPGDHVSVISEFFDLFSVQCFICFLFLFASDFVAETWEL